MSKPHDFERDQERREWEVQERAFREERASSSRRTAVGASADTGIYRLVVRALRNPRLDPLPSDFAVLTATRIEAELGAADFAEIWLERGLVVLLMLTGAAVVVNYSAEPLRALYYSVEPLRALWAALPRPTDLDPPSFGVWGLAIVACVALTWVLERWQGADRR